MLLVRNLDTISVAERLVKVVNVDGYIIGKEVFKKFLKRCFLMIF